MAQMAKKITFTKRWNVNSRYDFRVGYYIKNTQKWRYFKSQKDAQKFIKSLKILRTFK